MFFMHNINIKERMDIMNLIVFVGKIKRNSCIEKSTHGNTYATMKIEVTRPFCQQ